MGTSTRHPHVVLRPDTPEGRAARANATNVAYGEPYVPGRDRSTLEKLLSSKFTTAATAGGVGGGGDAGEGEGALHGDLQKEGLGSSGQRHNPHLRYGSFAQDDNYGDDGDAMTLMEGMGGVRGGGARKK
jgi:hypothetical protein